jgi:hypothetical protein
MGSSSKKKQKRLAVAEESRDEEKPDPKKDMAEMAKTPEGARIIHAYLLPGVVYHRHVSQIAGGDEIIMDSARRFVSDLIERFKPRDPVEEMLIAQMAWTHARLAKVSGQAGIQENVKWSQHLHEAADRAANTFRRQMLALAEYRRPPSNKSFTAIGQASIAQANIAQQQVVQNGKSENKNVTNELGSPASGDTRDVQTAIVEPAKQAAISSEPQGIGGTASLGGTEQAVAAEHRTADEPR